MITYDGVSYNYEGPENHTFPELYTIERDRKAGICKPLKLNQWLRFVLDLLLIIKCIEIENECREGLIFPKTDLLNKQCMKACWFFHKETARYSSNDAFTRKAIELLPAGLENDSSYAIGITSEVSWSADWDSSMNEKEFVSNSIHYFANAYSKIWSRAIFFDAISFRGFDKTDHINSLRDQLIAFIDKMHLIVDDMHKFEKTIVLQFAKYVQSIRNRFTGLIKLLNMKPPLIYPIVNKTLNNNWTWSFYTPDQISSPAEMDCVPLDLCMWNVLRILEWIRFTQLFCDRLSYEIKDGYFFSSTFSSIAKESYLRWIEQEMNICYHAYIIIQSFFHLQLNQRRCRYLKQTIKRLSDLQRHLTLEKIEKARNGQSLASFGALSYAQLPQYPDSFSFDHCFEFFRMTYSYLRVALSVAPFVYIKDAHPWISYLDEIKRSIFLAHSSLSQKQNVSSFNNTTLDESTLIKTFIVVVNERIPTLNNTYITSYEKFS